MASDIIAQAEEACEKLASRDRYVDRDYWNTVSGGLLPQLLAEAKRMRAENEELETQNETHWYNFEHLKEVVPALEKDRDAWKARAHRQARRSAGYRLAAKRHREEKVEWKAKADEERANIILGVEVSRLRDKTEADEIRFKAARELEEEMKHDI